MADPISKRKNFVKIETETQMEALKSLFYQNHFPHETNSDGSIYIRANQFEKLTQLLVGIEYELNSDHLEEERIIQDSTTSTFKRRKRKCTI